MNPSFKKLRELAKERKIKYYCFKSKKELCEELGLEYTPYTPGIITAPRKTTLRRVRDGKELYFPSVNALTKALNRNIGSILYYEKTKKPMLVVRLELIVSPGEYIIIERSKKMNTN